MTRRLEFGYRHLDCNFTKEQTQFVLPYPPEFGGLLARCIQGWRAGPPTRSCPRMSFQKRIL